MNVVLISRNRHDWLLFHNPDIQVCYDPTINADRLIIHSDHNYFNERVPSEVGKEIVEGLQYGIENEYKNTTIDLHAIYQDYEKKQKGVFQ